MSSDSRVPIKTAEELLRTPDLGRCELVRGAVRMMKPAGGEHGRVTAYLSFLLGTHIVNNRLGTFYAAGTGFVLRRDPDTVRAPDFAFIAAGRTASSECGFIPAAPDLAVEVLSPDDRPGFVREKVAEWLEAGAMEVWVVDPRERTVTLHRQGRPPSTFAETDTIRGRELLPGLELAVRDVFAM